MTLKGILQIIFAFIILAGFFSMYLAFNEVAQESLDAAKSLDFDRWGDSLVSLFMTGITLMIIGIIGEIAFSFMMPSGQER